MIKLSICIPVYKGLDTLKNQLNYFDRHMISGVEVIVSDDASGDDTAEFITDYSRKHPWMRAHVNEKNGGCDSNIRKLLTLSQGEYVLFLGDDYLAEEFLDDTMKFISESEPDIIHYNYGSFQKGHYEYKAHKKEFKTYFEEKYPEYCDKTIRTNDKFVSTIISNQISHFMFMSANVYRKVSILNCNDLIVDYGTTLLYSLSALKDGMLLYVTKEYIFSDPDITWSKRKYDVWFYWIPQILDKSKSFGYKQNDVRKMLDGHLSQCYVSKTKDWKSMFCYLKNNHCLNLLNVKNLSLALIYKCTLLKRKIGIYLRNISDNKRHRL